MPGKGSVSLSYWSLRGKKYPINDRRNHDPVSESNKTFIKRKTEQKTTIIPYQQSKVKFHPHMKAFILL